MSGPRSSRTRRRFLATLGTALSVGAAGCAETTTDGTPTGADTDAGGATTGDGTPGGTETGASAPARGRFADVYQQTIDSVALIRVYTSRGASGQGSGFVYRDDYLVTNEHVVDGGQRLEVRFAEGDWREGEIVGTDAYSDLAVVEVEDKPDYATPLDTVASEPPIGTEVVALGNPFGFGESVSSGIVSGVDRSLPGPNDFVIPDAIQTDAAVNPGNSGGPLVTLDGEVVGVVSSTGGDNLGFAISAALTDRVAPALIEDGDYEHSYMGVRIIGVSPTIADGNDLDEVAGVLVSEVVPDGPSDGVLQGSDSETTVNGVRVPVGGDVIRRMDGEPIPTQAALSTFLALNTSPGDTISVEVIRDGSRETVELTLGDRPRAVIPSL